MSFPESRRQSVMQHRLSAILAGTSSSMKAAAMEEEKLLAKFERAMENNNTFLAFLTAIVCDASSLYF